MNFQEYVPLAVRTANKDLPRELQFANTALGLCGEANELHQDMLNFQAYGTTEYYSKAVKELGDVLWYVALAADLSRVTEHLTFGENDRPGVKLFHSIGEYADLIKKHICQGHPRDDKAITEILGDIICSLRDIAMELNTTCEEAAEGNIRKLMERYPAGFEAKKSIHRKIGD
jgi:NTP pyrophosphatase (non-canonical NTP hydrolase)